MFLRAFQSSKISSFVSMVLVLMLACPNPASAQTLSSTPSLGSSIINPVLIRGIRVSSQDSFHLDFLIDSGATVSAQSRLQQETEQLIKYFLAGLTIQDQDLWVNLSPEEPDRIIPDSLARTDLGRDLLSQDYVLKQLTASLLNPDSETGKSFWMRIHETAYEVGVTEISADILKKIWIVPDFADVVVLPNGAYVESARLKVMLEGDQDTQKKEASLRGAAGDEAIPLKKIASQKTLAMTQDLIHQTILPAIEKEVNEGEAFMPLRQIYYSLILASWFKRHSAKSILGNSYIGQSKVEGIETADFQHKQKTYQQYLAAFRQGASDVIREEYDPKTQNVIPRHYFTGGIPMGNVKQASIEKPASKDFAMMLNGPAFSASVQVEPAMLSSPQKVLLIVIALIPIQSWRALAQKNLFYKMMLKHRKRIQWMFNNDSEVNEFFSRLAKKKSSFDLNDVRQFIVFDMMTRQMTGNAVHHKSDDRYYEDNVPAGAELREFYVDQNSKLRGLLYPAKNPAAPVVIFFPPFRKLADDFTGLVDVYRSLGDDVNVLLLDPRGNGRSDGDRRDLTTKDSQDLEEVIGQLKTIQIFSKSPIILHGMSHGALNSARLAAETDGLVDGLITQSLTSHHPTSVGLWLDGLLKHLWQEKLSRMFPNEQIEEDFYRTITQDIFHRIYGDAPLQPREYIQKSIEKGIPVRVIYEKDDRVLPLDVRTFITTHPRLAAVIPGDHIEGHKFQEGQKTIAESVHRVIQRLSSHNQDDIFLSYSAPEQLTQWRNVIERHSSKIKNVYMEASVGIDFWLRGGFLNLLSKKTELLQFISNSTIRSELDLLFSDQRRMNNILENIVWFESIAEDEGNFVLSQPNAAAVDFLNFLQREKISRCNRIVFNVFLRQLNLSEEDYHRAMKDFDEFLNQHGIEDHSQEAVDRFIKDRLGLDRNKNLYEEWLSHNSQYLNNREIWEAFVRHVFFKGLLSDSYININMVMISQEAQKLPEEFPALDDQYVARLIDILLKDHWPVDKSGKPVKAPMRYMAEAAMTTFDPQLWDRYSKYFISQNEDRGFHAYYVLNIIQHIFKFSTKDHPVESLGMGREGYPDWEGLIHHWPQLIDYVERMDREVKSDVRRQWWAQYRSSYVIAIVMALHPEIHFSDPQNDPDYFSDLLELAASTGRASKLISILKETQSDDFYGNVDLTNSDEWQENMMKVFQQFQSWEEFQHQFSEGREESGPNLERETSRKLLLQMQADQSLQKNIAEAIRRIQGLDSAMMAGDLLSVSSDPARERFWKFKSDRRENIVRSHYLSGLRAEGVVGGLVSKYAEMRDIFERVMSDNHLQNLIPEFDLRFIGEDIDKLFEGFVPFEAIVESEKSYFLGDGRYYAVDFLRYLNTQGDLYRYEYVLALLLTKNSVDDKQVIKILNDIEEAARHAEESGEDIRSFKDIVQEYVRRRIYEFRPEDLSDGRNAVDFFTTNSNIFSETDESHKALLLMRYMFGQKDKSDIDFHYPLAKDQQWPDYNKFLPSPNQVSRMMAAIYQYLPIQRGILKNFGLGLEEALAAEVFNQIFWLRNSYYAAQWPQEYGIGLYYLKDITAHLNTREGQGGILGHRPESRDFGLSQSIPDFEGWFVHLGNVLEFFFDMERKAAVPTDENSLEIQWWNSYRDMYAGMIALAFDSGIDPDRTLPYFKENPLGFRHLLLERLVDRGYAEDAQKLWNELLSFNLDFVELEFAQRSIFDAISHDFLPLAVYRRMNPNERSEKLPEDLLANWRNSQEKTQRSIRDDLMNDLKYMKNYQDELKSRSLEVTARGDAAMISDQDDPLKGGIDFSNKTLNVKETFFNSGADSAQMSSTLSKVSFSSLKPVVLSLTPLADPASFWK